MTLKDSFWSLLILNKSKITYDYSVVILQDGKKNPTSVGYSYQPEMVLPSDGAVDFDKWECVLDGIVADYADSGITKGTFKIGVYARSNRQDVADSDPAYASATIKLD